MTFEITRQNLDNLQLFYVKQKDNIATIFLYHHFQGFYNITKKNNFFYFSLNKEGSYPSGASNPKRLTIVAATFASPAFSVYCNE